MQATKGDGTIDISIPIGEARTLLAGREDARLGALLGAAVSAYEETRAGRSLAVDGIAVAHEIRGDSAGFDCPGCPRSFSTAASMRGHRTRTGH